MRSRKTKWRHFPSRRGQRAGNSPNKDSGKRSAVSTGEVVASGVGGQEVVASAASGQDRAQVPLVFEKLVALSLLLPTFAWAFWPTLREVIADWSTEPDYSHGFFVLPLACLILWMRRDAFTGVAPGICWPACGLLGVSAALRVVAAVYYLEALDAWSMVVWIAGVVWLLGGLQLLRWSWPAIVFLLFAIPLPFRIEHMLSWPLQRVATMISAWMLQLLGQPALSEGNTILLGEHQLEVARACSGLRIFVGIAALAFFYVVVVRRPWWTRLLLLAAVLPIALLANSARIVVTGLLYRLASGEMAHKFSHDLAGYFMIPFAALLFALVLWYLGQLIHPAEKPVESLAAK